VVVKDWKAKRAHQGEKRYAIDPDDLVPLPFDAPKLHGLLVSAWTTALGLDCGTHV
jgi:hypothetical protein